MYEDNYDNRYGHVITGYFTAPASANYRFYVSSDDSSRLYLDTVPYDETSDAVEPNLVLIAYSGNRGWRNYFTQNEGQISDWIPLEAGRSYLI